MNELNADGILPLESNSSFESIRHTESEYQTVNALAINTHDNGKPDSGQIIGTRPSNNRSEQ